MKAIKKLDPIPKNPNHWSIEDENESLKRMAKKFSLASKIQNTSKNQD